MFVAVFDQSGEAGTFKSMVRLCAKVVAEQDLYETDKKVPNPIDWVCLSEQIKENNNTIAV